MPRRIWKKLTERPVGQRAREIFYYFVFPPLARGLRRGTFHYDGRDLSYFCSRKNLALATERAIEIPVALHHLRNRDSAMRILEIGNVLPQYIPQANWDVVDKYEEGVRVISEDILDFRPEQRYALVISISTIEHIGYNEPVRDPAKLPAALDHIIQNVLADDGEFIATFPLGWNPTLDELFRGGKLPFQTMTVFCRRGWKNEWVEIDAGHAIYKYGTCLGADCIVVGRFTRRKSTGS